MVRIFNYKAIHSKKSSLSLSINAIVVLILAITMLGLGLGFMKGMFTKVSKQVETAIDATELDNPPTADKPMTMSARNINLKRGESFRLDIGFFNKYNEEVTTNINNGSCTSGGASSGSDFIFTKPSDRSTEVNGKEAFSILIEINKSATSRTNVCTFILTSGATDGDPALLGTLSKELFIKVP